MTPKEIEDRIAQAEETAKAALDGMFAIARLLALRGAIDEDGINAIAAAAAAGVERQSVSSNALRGYIRNARRELIGHLPHVL
jgi:hypothetical protein